MDDLVYQTIAWDYNAKQTAREFARKWFPKPREIENFVEAETFRHATFNLVNGCAKYKVVYQEGVPLVDAPIWKVYRISPQEQKG